MKKMVMKKLILLSVLVVAMVGCSIEPKDEVFIDPAKRAAMDLAQVEVGEIASDNRTSFWNSTSKVVDAFPVYLDGIEGISYYECKVMTDGVDRGYVLVNINDTDFPIVEACEDGLTVNETFEEITTQSKEDFVVYRYSYTASAVFKKIDDSNSVVSKGGSTREPIASIGFDNIDEFDFEEYRSQVKANKGSLFSTVVTEKSSQGTELLGMTGKGNARVGLDHQWNYSKWTGSTPPWSSYDLPAHTRDERTSLLMSIIYAYWHVKKGYTKLFETEFLTDSTNQDVINNALINIEYPSTEFTTRLAIERIARIGMISYAHRRGYSASTMVEKNGGYDTKFNMIYDSLAEDRPVLMRINVNGIGLATGFAIIEYARRQSVAWNSYIRYYCNMGYGIRYARPDGRATANKWVYAYNQKPVEQTAPGYTAKRHSTYQIWDIHVR